MLSNAFAIVTGGGGGIGRAICMALACCGTTVWAVGRSAPPLSHTASRVQGRVKAYVADLEDEAQIAQLARDAEREHGRLDILVHSAGTIAHGTVGEAPLAVLDSQFRSNMRLPYGVTRELLPLLRKAPGQIVFINSSIVDGAPRSNVGHYAAMQHAVRAFADTLREEVNADGIRVLCVYPGRTATPRQAKLYRSRGDAYRPEVLLQPEDIATMVTAAVALPPTAEVTEIKLRPLRKSY